MVSVKKIVALILALCILCTVFTVCAEEQQQIISFSDVPESDSTYTAIMYLAEKGIISGKGNSLFGPDDTLKREELAKILTNAFGLTMTEKAPVFKDVPAGVWYADFVRTIAESKLMVGTSENEFGTGQNITRQDLAVILKRFLEKKGVDITTDNTIMFADLSQISDYAKESVTVLGSMDIMPAKENNCFLPNENATRADTAVAIYKAIKIKEEQARALGRYGDHTQYQGPFEMPDDRLQQAMPELFAVDNLDGALVHYEDFEDEDYGEFSYRYSTAAATVEKGAGIDGSSAFVIEGSGEEIYTPQLYLTYKPGEIMPGDYFIFSVMIRAEGISGSGHYRGIFTVYDDQGKWLTESSGGKGTTDLTEWTKFEYVVMVPFGKANTYTTTEFYTIAMSLYKNKMAGKVYFDNMTLKKARFDPMNTVLMTPNYKGLITEENGIGDISLRAYVDHLNLWDLGTFDFTAQITDDDHNVLMKSENKNVTAAMDVYFSSKDLDVDKNYYLESILTDKETGEVIQKHEWPLYKRAPDFVPAIGYDEYGRVTKNGEPFIPKSVYNWLDPNDAKDLYDTGSINVIQQGDFGSTVHFGTMPLAQENDREFGERGILWNAQARPFSQRNEASAWTKNYVGNWPDTRGALGRMAENFNDAPNIYAYYLWDEQDPIQFGAQLEWTRKIIEHYDLEHPTLCAIDKTNDHRKGIYAKTSDFLGYDPYPVTGRHTSLGIVYDHIKVGQKTNPNRPVYAILQGYWDSGRGDLRGPTLEEFRNMAFQAIYAGSCMLDCFAWSGNIKTNPSPGTTAEEGLQIIVDVYAEIQYLEPIILSVDPAPYYEVAAGDWFRHMTKRHDGKSYLFTLNTEEKDGTAKVYLDGVKEMRSMYTDTVYKADKSGWFTIDMTGYGVDVFEYEQEDYKSSHAELKRFGLTGITMMNSESEVPCFVVPEGTTKVDYNFAISDFAKLYINGVEMEIKGTIDLSGLDKLEIKVVSEDERFTTEKICLIEWVK